MNPDNRQTPTPAPNTPAKLPKSGWKSRLSSLDWPQRALVLLGLVLAILVLTLAAYQAFREEQPTPTTRVTAPATATVSITPDGLTPATITIKEGTQLTWINNDTNSHQPTADPHPLNNSIAGFEGNTTLLPADSLSFTFEQAGSYTYHDHLNPLDKKYFGTVVVE